MFDMNEPAMRATAAPVALEPSSLDLELCATDAEEAIERLHAGLVGRDGVVDSGSLLHELKRRSRLGAICLDEDVAIPHAHTDAVTRLVLAVGRASGGIRFGPDHLRIRLVFVIGVPSHGVSDYLRCMARLTRLLRDPVARGTLLRTDSVSEFRAVLHEAGRPGR